MAKVSYAVLPKRTHPPRWAVDALAWCWGKGGAWQTQLRPFLRHEHLAP